MKLPEPIAGFQWNQGWRHWEQVIPEAMRSEGVVPMYSEAQLREALAAQQEAENEANERNLCQLTDELAESRREVAQLQEQNTALDARLASNEAVMRMAFVALFEATCRCPQMEDAMDALEEALK